MFANLANELGHHHAVEGIGWKITLARVLPDMSINKTQRMECLSIWLAADQF